MWYYSGMTKNVVVIENGIATVASGKAEVIDMNFEGIDATTETLEHYLEVARANGLSLDIQKRIEAELEFSRELGSRESLIL